MLRESKSYWAEFVPKFFVLIKKKYTFAIFRKDLISGLTVGIVALPLAMAFGIASGVTPAQGLYTAIIAGFLISFLGGSRYQIGGPTGAFVVIIYDVIQRNGYEGLVWATLIAAVLLILIGLLRLGTLIKYIPYPLTMGFTAGIAVVIFSSQMRDFFGLQMGSLPVDFVDKWAAYWNAAPTWNPVTLSVGLGTLGLIIAIRRYFPIIPWGVGSIACATIVCWLFHIPIETIETRYGDIPRSLPFPSFPKLNLTFDQIRLLVPDAVTIALLAGIESLLSAVIADGMTGKKHKSNCELVGQGIANLGSIIFGGIPATGAIARTAINVKSGGQTPVSGVIHAITIFGIMISFSPIVSKMPIPSLAAVLIMIAWNMSEAHHIRRLFKAPTGDIAVLLSAFFLTVFIDLTVAVEVGMILAAFLFMKRMSDLSSIFPVAKIFEEKIVEFPERLDPNAIEKKKIPKGVEVYEIEGPFFFGVADLLKDVLHNVESPPKVFILRMRKVTVIDATGLYALSEFFRQCDKEKTILLLSGVRGEAAHAIKDYGLQEVIGDRNMLPDIDSALRRARDLVESS